MGASRFDTHQIQGIIIGPRLWLYKGGETDDAECGIGLPGATSGAKIAVATRPVPGFGVDGYRFDIFTQSGADRDVHGSIQGRPHLDPADGRTGLREGAERVWGAGIKFDLARNHQMWDTGSTAQAAPELTCGAGLMDEPVYVVDPQGRIVRTIAR